MSKAKTTQPNVIHKVIMVGSGGVGKSAIVVLYTQGVFLRRVSSDKIEN